MSDKAWLAISNDYKDLGVTFARDENEALWKLSRNNIYPFQVVELSNESAWAIIDFIEPSIQDAGLPDVGF